MAAETPSTPAPLDSDEVKRLAQEVGQDLDRIAERARRLGAADGLAEAAQLLVDLSGLAQPEPVRQALLGAAQAIVSRARERLGA